MATIFVDNKQYSVDDGQNLLAACLQLGFNLPYFCWHPAMHSVGACRQCAVKQFRDEHDTRGRIVMACMTPAAEGSRISIDDPEAKAFRAGAVEWLMINHPHDCPVCDEGGECHLQDMTVMTGHDYRRHRFAKRTYRNQYLGPFVNHEMNRCIQCYRCVRFYCDYAGGRDLGVFAAHDSVYFGRKEDGVLESEFSGNLVEVCPTGVFTDATLKQHYTRKWDLQTAPSICVHCGLGCNTIPGERYGMLRRIHNRYSRAVNGYFLCDRGRYGYEFVNSAKRIGAPRHHATETAKGDVLRQVGAMLQASAGVIGIGSPRASLEANFALRALVGPAHFYAGVSARSHREMATAIDMLRLGPARSASLHDAEMSDAVFVLGEDVPNVAPRLALALRQSVRQQPLRKADELRIPLWHDAAVREAIQDARGPLFLATIAGTRLDEIATQTYHSAPDDLARLAYAVARSLGASASAVAGLGDDARTFADRVAQALREAQRPLIISGTSLGNEALVHAAALIAAGLCAIGKDARLSYVVPECNSLGLGLIGGGDLSQAFAAVQSGQADTVVILENDLYRRADAALVDAFLAAAKHVIALDCIENETTQRAAVVLPAASFAEGDGTLVSGEGRAQRFFQVFVPEGAIQESWRWLRDIMAAAGRGEATPWRTLDDVIAALATALPALGPIVDAAPNARFRHAGMKVPRQPQRYSGRTAMHAHVDVSERRPPDDPDSALAFSMEGYDGQPPPALIPRFWAPGWNSVQALNKFQAEIGGPLRGGDPGVRLFEATEKVKEEGRLPAADAPAAFRQRPGEWLLVPLYHVFGSEELSISTPGVADRSPAPYLGLNTEDARALDLSFGEEIAIVLGGRRRRLAVRLTPEMPKGVAGVPAGIPAMVGVALPVWCRLSEYSRGFPGPQP